MTTEASVSSLKRMNIFMAFSSWTYLWFSFKILSMHMRFREMEDSWHLFYCCNCKFAKFSALHFLKSVSMSLAPFDLVHSHVWGASPAPRKVGLSIMSLLLLIVVVFVEFILWSRENINISLEQPVPIFCLLMLLVSFWEKMFSLSLILLVRF